jgi:maltose alpha-D-glucosyltransferase/alpha-amylase
VRPTRTSDLWWKNAVVVHRLDVETFADGNGDGCGDFRGVDAVPFLLETAGQDDAGALPDPPEDGHRATFVRNHDELTPDKLTDGQRAEVFAAFGPDEDMQLYGRGLRRRLPSMLDGDERRIRMVYSLLFALPGTPVLFYGEEIGMVEDLSLPGRFAVRSDMDWAAAREQTREPGALLSWMRLLVDSYRACPELAWGSYTVPDPGPGARPVLAHRRDADGSTVVALHNLADAEVRAAPVLAGPPGAELVDVHDPAAEPVRLDEEGRAALVLAPYGCRRLRTA